jgi:hypothetical protein
MGQTFNKTLGDGVKTIQGRISKATQLLLQGGLGNVQVVAGSVLIAATSPINNGSFFSNVQQPVTFTLTSTGSESLVNGTERVLNAIQRSGLISLQTQTFGPALGGAQVSFQFSDSTENQLHAQAYNAAVQNATNTANKIAAAQGLTITGVSQAVEMPAVQSQNSNFLSFYLALYGGGNPSQTFQVSVQVTFLVQKP